MSDHEAAIPNPALKPFSVSVGTWTTSAHTRWFPARRGHDVRQVKREPHEEEADRGDPVDGACPHRLIRRVRRGMCLYLGAASIRPAARGLYFSHAIHCWGA